MLKVLCLFQASKSSVRSNSKVLCIEEIIERLGSYISKSKIDIAFLSPNDRLLLSLIEVNLRPVEEILENQEIQDAIKQTTCFSIVLLAYSVRGVLRKDIELVTFKASCL